MKRIIALCLLLAAPLVPASILTVTKTPIETFDIGVDFAKPAGAHAITLVAVVATDISTGTNVTSTLIASSPAPAVYSAVTVAGVERTGKFIVARLQGGANNQRVLVGMRAQDAVTGAIYEGQITVQVSSGLAH